MLLTQLWKSFTLCITLLLVLVHHSLSTGPNGNAEQVHRASPSSAPSSVTGGTKGQAKGGGCYKGDLVCAKDKLGYEAIATLHHQMDDDQNGDIDLEESAEFLIEELQYSESHWSEHRSKTFHMNDTHITIDDLWNMWKNSSVHNWTIDQVVSWLAYEVELPQYSDQFKMNAVDGSTLPRLAVNNLNFVSNILGIKNLVHKQKLANKATDVVLFGPPKSRHNWYKDVALVTAIAVAAGGCWFAYRQNRQLEINMARTMRDMDSLAKSELALKQLQERLENEQLEKRRHIQHKEQLEQQVQLEISEARLEAHRLKLTKEQTENQLSQFKEMRSELERTKQALIIAEKELEVRSSLTPSLELQKWLQITYELELKVYNEKKAVAEQQLMNAKDSCEKLRRKKQALFGSLRMANSGSIDETEHIIITAKKALEEVKHDLAERQYRWQQVEHMCPFSIISNPGIKALIHSTGHIDLYRFCHGGTLLDASGSTDLDDFDDIPPTYGAVLAAIQCNGYNVIKRGRTSQPPSVASQPTLASTMPGNHVNRSAATSSNRHLFRSIVPSSSGPPSSGPPSTTGPLSPAAENSSREATPSVEDSQDVTSLDDTQMTKRNDPTTPQFGLYGDDPESTSSSSESSNIPRRPKLQRHTALHETTDSMSVCSEQAPASQSLRARTLTAESLPTKKRRDKSPLTLNTTMSNSVHVLSNSSTTMKRSRTTDLHTLKVRDGVKMSASADCLSKPGSAPASLVAGRDDSDTSLSSGSKDNLSNNKRKVKKKGHIMSLFKMKLRTT